MKRLSFYGLMLFFVLLYTQGLWRGIGIPKLVVDGALLLLPLAVLLSQRGVPGNPAPGFLFIWFYLGWSLSACIYNDEGAVRGLLYARYLVAAYIVFWGVWNSRFTRRQLLWINTVIFIMFFVQIAAAAFELFVFRRAVEDNVGVMGQATGAIATVFPVFAFCCMLAFFLYYNRPLFLIAGFAFLLVGHASGKLAIYYFIPAALVVGLVLYAIEAGLPSAIRRSSVVAFVVVCALPLIVLMLSHNRRMTMLQSESGMYNKIKLFFDHTHRSQMEEKSWYTGSRTGTSRRIIQETFKRGPLVFLFGRGPHVLLEMSGQTTQGAYDEYGIVYGIVGWSADALTVGWPAMFAHAGFYTYLFHLLLKTRRTLRLGTYWRAIWLAVELGFFVFLLMYFLYSTHFTVGGWLSSVYLYFLAVLLAPQYREILCLHPGEAPEEEMVDLPRVRRRLAGMYGTMGGY